MEFPVDELIEICPLDLRFAKTLLITIHEVRGGVLERRIEGGELVRKLEPIDPDRQFPIEQFDQEAVIHRASRRRWQFFVTQVLFPH